MKKYLRLMRYLRPHTAALIMVLVTMVLTVALELLRPWPTKLLVDQVLNHKSVPPQLHGLLSLLPGSSGDKGLLLWVCISTVLIFLLGTFMSMVNTLVSITLGQRVTYDLGADLFLHLQRLSLLYHSRRPVGDSIARVTGDPYCVQVLLNSVAIPLLQSIMTLGMMFVVMWSLSPQLTLIALAAGPLMVITIRVFGRSMKDRSREKRDLEGQMMSTVQEALSAMPAVQAFTREEMEHARFVRYADRAVVAWRKVTLSQMWFKLFVGLITAVGTAGLMYLGGLYALNGAVTVGTILVFLAYLQALYTPLNQMAFTASVFQEAAANADRVMEILDVKPDVADAPHARHAALRGHVTYEDVTFGYESGRPALRNVSLEAMKGDVIAIVGPTGAGKSTLANLLPRFFDPVEGRVTIDGYDVRDLHVRSLREQIAIVLQEPFIFPMTVAENIAYGRPDASREQIVACAVAANADEFIRRLPKGYDSIIGERGATLSGGERQRLSIARAFLKDAPILILDEPTSALDARTEALLLDALERLMSGRTTFIIAHRFSTIRRADQILVLDRGQIVEQGRHEQLLAGRGLYAALYSQQMEIAHHETVAG